MTDHEQSFQLYPAEVTQEHGGYTSTRIRDALRKAREDYRAPVIRVMTQQVGTGEWIDVVHLTPDSRKQRRRAQEVVEGLRALGLHAHMKIENEKEES